MATERVLVTVQEKVIRFMDPLRHLETDIDQMTTLLRKKKQRWKKKKSSSLEERVSELNEVGAVAKRIK